MKCKKMFVWTKESIRWYLRAGERTGYYRKLAGQLRNYIGPEDHVADLGCGLGQIDLEIASRAGRVTSVDTEEKVTEILKREADRKKLSNLTVRCMDWRELEEEFCDVLLLCSFGRIQEDLEDFLRLCRKRILFLRRSQREMERGFAAPYHLENPVEKEEAFAREAGLKTCVRRFQAEFGQPFSDMEEAVRFIRHYQVKTGGLSPEEYLRRHLEYKKDGKFPLYLPNEKEMYLLIIEKNFEK